jgi:putative oxidoreductase
MFESMGLRPGRPLAVATGLAESFAGAAAILGIATRPAALAVLVTQAVAIWKVHSPKGFSVLAGGMEYNLALMAIAAGLLVEGPRAVSLHRVVRNRTGPARALTSRWPRLDALGGFARRARPTAMSRALDILH